uniref:RIKEN cDNA 9430069I07 gene n=1 Tax=Mus spicilegus TaxID=10103 RepID=A0A8C6HCE6_MUSSI
MSITKAAGSLRISRMGRVQCLTTEMYEPGVLRQKWAQLCSKTLHMWTAAKEDKEGFLGAPRQTQVLFGMRSSRKLSWAMKDTSCPHPFFYKENIFPTVLRLMHGEKVLRL